MLNSKTRSFVLMNAKIEERLVKGTDITTYILVGFVVLTVLVGSITILLF